MKPYTHMHACKHKMGYIQRKNVVNLLACTSFVNIKLIFIMNLLIFFVIDLYVGESKIVY